MPLHAKPGGTAKLTLRPSDGTGRFFMAASGDWREARKGQGDRSLPPQLRETAQLRLQYPEMSLEELGMMCDPPLGKSGVNHRMRRLERMAAELDE